MEFPKKNKKGPFFWVIRIAKNVDTLQFGVLSLTYQILVKFGCKKKNGPFFLFFFNFCFKSKIFSKSWYKMVENRDI